MAKNDKQIPEKPVVKADDNVEIKTESVVDAKHENNKSKGSFAKKVKAKLILLLVLLGIGGVGYLAVTSSMQKHSAADKNSAAVQVTSNSAEKRIAQLETKVAELQVLVNRAAQNQGVSEDIVDKKVGQLRSEVKIALDNVMAQAAASAKAAEDKAGQADAPQVVKTVTEVKLSQEMLLANGAIMVRDLAEKGLPFAYEAEVLRILAQGNIPATEYAQIIQRYAASGVKGKNILTSAFNRFYASLNNSKCTDAEVKPVEVKEPTTWDEKAIAWLKSAIIRKKKAPMPVFIPQEDKVYELVNSGNLAEALRTMQTDAKYAQIESPFLQEWKAQVQNYLIFESAVSGLIMNALANVHLKEMEH
ncbi:MAG: hypothetical protein VZR95_00125 [Alphaproteobacteria bacterium]